MIFTNVAVSVHYCSHPRLFTTIAVVDVHTRLFYINIMLPFIIYSFSSESGKFIALNKFVMSKDTWLCISETVILKLEKNNRCCTYLQIPIQGYECTGRIATIKGASQGAAHFGLGNRSQHIDI